MAKRVRIELDHDGFTELLNSAEVKADLRTRAERIVAAAGAGVEYKEMQFTYGGSPRAGILIRTETDEAKRAEAEDKTLTRALESGR